MIKALFIFSIVFQQILQAQNSSGLVKSPDVMPVLFSEININTNLRERDFALSPDGREIFYTLQSPGNNFHTILYLQKDQKGNGRKPKETPFAWNFSVL